MPKSRFLQYLMLLALLILGLSAKTFSQSSSELARMYNDNRMQELDELRKKDAIKSSDWKIFVDALFETDGERAIQQMLQAYSYSNDSKLKRIIRERVSQFYSARGYYETSSRILDDEKFFDGIVALKQNSRPNNNVNAVNSEDQVERVDENGQTFGVQVGAYSNYENAQQASQKYLEVYPNTKVLNKVKDGMNLYIIVIGGYPSRGEASEQIDEISRRFKVKGYIIQY